VSEKDVRKKESMTKILRQSESDKGMEDGSQNQYI
jgi:hypothetical protein